jgi:basic membrane protein A
MASKTGKVGFVGGMDIPLIRKFGCGYVRAQGGQKRREVFQNMTGTTRCCLERPGSRRRNHQEPDRPGRRRHLRGGRRTGLGVLQTAADNGKLGIGVDSNQNYLQPGKVLTSMLKRVDLAVYNAFMDDQGRQVQGGVQSLGVKEGGVSTAIDEQQQGARSPTR